MSSNTLTGSPLSPRTLRFLGAVGALMFAPVLFAAGLQPVDLRCEYRHEPLGIDEAAPRLTWRLEGKGRAQRQSAYQLLVASTPEKLRKGEADLWDSGRVSGADTANIPYAGRKLESRQRCYWKVQVWDQDNRPCGWSRPAMWAMGLLDRDQWKARYISYRDKTPVFKDNSSLFLPPARQYRREFDAPKKVQRATLYATALGIYELYLNGNRVGDASFAPGWTDYHQRAYYWTHDVTKSVQRGKNAIGAWVADGWYSGYIGFGLLTGIGTEKIGRYTYGKTPAFMAQLEIEYTDGSREVVVTDPTWKVTGEGPIREADFLMGEYYDARREMPGWSRPGFDDGAWERAIAAEDNGPVKATFYEHRNPRGSGGTKIEGREVDLGFKAPPRLEAFPGVPVRATQEIKPIAISTPEKGVYIFNLGQNFAGTVRLKVKGPAGATIKLRYGEMLHPDGRLMTENLRKARATDHYVLRGDSHGEVFIPRFTFHGFQYVELTGFPGKPDKDAITGIVLHSDTPLTSGFECSDPRANRLFKNIVWTQRANFVDLPTDCPQRDERFGWTGDAQVYVRTATYNADVAAFYTKWLRELMESQRPSGTFPGYAPYPFQHGMDFGTAWCDAGVICPYTVYLAYGDKRIIERCWEPMTRFIEWRKNTSKDYLGVSHGNGWGDWLSIGGSTPIEFIDTAYFAYSTRLMAEMAQVIGKNSEAATYRDLAQKVTDAFNKRYVRPDGSIEVDTQTAYAMALWMDLLPQNLRNASGQILANKIRATASSTNSGITTGFLGTRPLLPALTAVGQNDLAVRLFQSRSFPSWGFEVENGATTIWERWNSYTREKGFGGEQNASMNSFAHYSFGAVGEWMLGTLAGINTDGPAYHHIIIHPQPPRAESNPERKPIDWVKAHYDSLQGRISSEWTATAGAFHLNVTIPPNTTATVFIPARDSAGVTEGKRALDRSKEVKFLRMQNGCAVLEVPSGTYSFESKTGA